MRNDIWKKIKQYFSVQIKRVIVVLPAVFITTIITVAVIGIAGSFMLTQMSSGEKQTMFRMGVGGNVTDSYLGIGISALKRIDSSRFAVELVEMPPDEGYQELLAGDIHAYVEIPEGFVDSVVHAKNLPVALYTRNGQAGLGTILLKEFSGVISDWIVKTQNAILGMRSLCRNYSDADEYRLADEMALTYINFILNRTNICKFDTLGVSNELSLAGYYVCGFLILFFMIWGLNGCKLFVREDTSVYTMLFANGKGALVQVVCEFAAYFILALSCFFSVFGILGFICSTAQISIPEWEVIDIRLLIRFGLQMIPVMVLVLTITYLGHELVTNIVNGVLLQFMITVVMGFCSGCFYPISFFPESIQRIGTVLPIGTAMEYAAKCIRGQVGSTDWSGLAAYSIIFLGLSVVIRQKKLAVR